NSGTSYDPTGPDVVLRYDAKAAGEVDFTFTKPASTRWHFYFTEGTCGLDQSKDYCDSDFSATAWTQTIRVKANTSYFLYVVDTSSGANPLGGAPEVTVTERATGPRPCPPGTNGVLGADYQTRWTGWTGTFTENYMGVDSDPNGWVYVGGTSSLM